MQVRRVLLITLIGLVAAPSAGAALERTAGSRYVQFAEGAGVAKVRLAGNFFGRVGRGRIVATRNVIVSGCASRRPVSEALMECRGRRITFRAQASTIWSVRLSGHRINASGFVRGCMTLNGVDGSDPGRFKIGQYAALRAWPRTATTYTLGTGC
jgi:hypothetical protein